MLPEDILSEFINEANELLQQLSEVIQDLELEHEEFPSELLKVFAQRIDRIFGAAKTIALSDPDNPSLKAIGSIAETCKKIGYRAAEKKDLRLLPFFSAFWSDAVENIETLLVHIQDVEKSAQTVTQISNVLQGRLKWLEDKLK